MTPMIKQYYELKGQADDAILLFRMGDFYEIFGDDARTVAPKLDLVLTSRERGDQTQIPFCGVPHHSIKSYWIKLLRFGYKVAIAEQVEDPKQAKGIVKREITQIMSPGTIQDPEALENEEPNYLGSLYEVPDEELFFLSIWDLNSGIVRVSDQLGFKETLALLEEFKPSELVLREFCHKRFLEALAQRNLRTVLSKLPEAPLRDLDGAQAKVQEFFPCNSIQEVPAGLACLLASTLRYLEHCRVGLGHLKALCSLRDEGRMVLSEVAVRDLELFLSAQRREQKGSLIEQINYTSTPMGARFLRSALRYPLIMPEAIEGRLADVEYLGNYPSTWPTIQKLLKECGDLERLTAKLVAGRFQTRDLVKLRAATTALTGLRNLLISEMPGWAERMFPENGLDRVHDLLVAHIAEEPDLNLTGLGFVKKGFNSTLDNLRKLAIEGQSQIDAYEQELKSETGITSLKIKSHKTFGLLIEVTRANAAKVPDTFIRKQTMVNNERFTTIALRELDEVLSGASDKAISKEEEIVFGLLAKLRGFADELLSLATKISYFDFVLGLAQLARSRELVRPLLGRKIKLEASRHLVVEAFVSRENYVVNDIVLGPKEQMMLLTGPNMAGKSTIMRQVALSAILHQLGSFVPARSAELPVFDQIFTRVGASDDLAMGQSTFMVEMSETAQLLRRATRRSLVIVDEVGRGTSSKDGFALAAAILEDICRRLKCYGMFATHYHELVESCAGLPGLSFYKTEVIDDSGSIRFTHRLTRGSSESSFGIEVAKLAGLPQDVIARAKDLLNQSSPDPKYRRSQPPLERAGFSFDENRWPADWEKVRRRLEKVDISHMTPLESLNILNDLSKLMNSKDQASDVFEIH